MEGRGACNAGSCPDSAPMSTPSDACSRLAAQFPNECPCSAGDGSLLRPPLRVEPSSGAFFGDSDRRVACREYLECSRAGMIRDACHAHRDP